MLIKYLNYIKDNPQGYWFKAKWFGWGWTPVTWQGWLITLVFIGFIAILSSGINENAPFSETLIPFWLPFALATMLFMFIAYKKGEKPHWQWGPPKKS